MAIEKVGVVGCGLMGHGIVQVAAQGGFRVVAVEAEQKFLDSGLGRIDKSLAKLAEKSVKDGKTTPEQAQARAAEVRARISGATERAAGSTGAPRSSASTSAASSASPATSPTTTTPTTSTCTARSCGGAGCR